MTIGLIVGRFDPPHAGHVLLADTAGRLVERLVILVEEGDARCGSAALRIGLLRELLPWADVRPVDAVTPPAIRATCPEPVACLFGADAERKALAEALGARLVAIDPARETIPVSGADIRRDPFAHWRYLPPAVRPMFARTICLHGPESTGKSTLAPLLAAHFNTIHVPEYGRTYCEEFGLTLAMGDLVAIGRTHAALTRAALTQCNRRLILDTDPLMTAAWADMLFERRDPWFDAFEETADLYLLLDIDLPWVDDGTRFFGDAERRRRFFALSRAELERRGLPYAVVGGPAEERLDRALDAIVAAGLG